MSISCFGMRVHGRLNMSLPLGWNPPLNFPELPPSDSPSQMPSLVHCSIQVEGLFSLGGLPVMAEFTQQLMGMPVETGGAHSPMPSATSGAPGPL